MRDIQTVTCDELRVLPRDDVPAGRNPGAATSLGLDVSDPGDHAPPGWEQININLRAGSYVIIHRRDWHARGCPEAYVGQTPEDLDITDFIDA